MDVKKIKAAVSNKFIYFVLLGMVIIMTVASENFLTATNIINILVSKSCHGILALGIALVIITGGIDLSVGAVVSLSAVIATSLVQEVSYTGKVIPGLGELPVGIAVLAGIAVGVVAGICNGYLVAYRKVPPFIATLGMQVMMDGISLTWTKGYPVSMLRSDYKIIGSYKIFGQIPITIIYWIIIAVVVWVLLNKTKFGKALFAIGGNERAAINSGINVKHTLFSVYLFSGLLAGIGGVALSARNAAGICTMGTGYELDAIEAAVIGGVSMSGGIGTIGGIIVGTLILGIMDNGLLLLGTSAYVQKIFKGIIILLAVILDMWKNSRKK